MLKRLIVLTTQTGFSALMAAFMAASGYGAWLNNQPLGAFLGVAWFVVFSALASGFAKKLVDLGDES